MTQEQPRTLTGVIDIINQSIHDEDLAGLADAVGRLNVQQLVTVLGRFDARRRAVAYRLLPKDRALDVFEALPPALQGELVAALQHEEVAHLFAGLDPDDRVQLLDELPASVAQRLLKGLPDQARQSTAEVLGYPRESIGRRMSPEVVTAHPESTAAAALHRLRSRSGDAETIYTLPVVDEQRRIVGVASLRDLLGSDERKPLAEIMQPALVAVATEDAERAAQRCAQAGVLALPVVDGESRVVGIFTIDDAVRILRDEFSEDVARQGGAEPLRRPYLSTPVLSIVRSRVVWLLVLAVGATLTVQVLSVFETTLASLTVLALFVPLLIGTGGNTGNQAATTVTRALALQDIHPGDTVRVLAREARVGFLLGVLLGCLGFAITSLVYTVGVGVVIGLTLIAVCTLAALAGGAMPLLARTIHVDPAVFSNPFISTFVDAAGLVVYFLIARAVLHL